MMKNKKKYHKELNRKFDDKTKIGPALISTLLINIAGLNVDREEFFFPLATKTNLNLYNRLNFGTKVRPKISA